MVVLNFLPKQMSPHMNHLVPVNFVFQVVIGLTIMSDYRDLIVKYQKSFQ